MRPRVLLIAAIAFGALTASLAAMVVYLQRLPEPEQADRRGLCRWLIEVDLPTQSPELVERIIRRVERELLDGIDLREVATMVTPEQRVRLLASCDYLGRRWFVDEADEYLAAPDGDKPRVLGEQLAHLKRLGIMEQLAALDEPRPGEPQPSEPSSQKSVGIASHAARVQRWMQEAAPVERDRMARYYAAIQTRLWSESVGHWLTGQ